MKEPRDELVRYAYGFSDRKPRWTVQAIVCSVALYGCMTHTTAKADTVTVGYFDPAASLSGIQVLGQASGTFPMVQLIGLPILPTGPTGFGFDQILAAVIPPGGNNISGGLGGPNPTFEFTFNDGFSPPQGGTSYLYASWEGIYTGDPLIILPTLWGSIEAPPVNPGYTLTTQVLVCNTPNPFCGPFVGGGTVLGQDQFSGPPSLDSITLTGLLPGQNFKISEIFAFTGGPSPPFAQGDVGGLIETTFQSPTMVPAPIAGAGIPGLLAALGGLVWLGRRRSKK